MMQEASHVVEYLIIEKLTEIGLWTESHVESDY